MPPSIQDTLLDLFEHVRQDPDTIPTVPVDRWQEGSVEWLLLSGFQAMLDQVQQRLFQLLHTEQLLPEREEQYRSIFEATNDAVFIMDIEDGHIIEANPAACNMYGYSYEEFIGLPPSAVIHPNQLPTFREKGIPLIKAGGKRHIQGVNLRKDGSEFPIDLHQTAFTYQGKPHILSVMRDITEQIQAEQQLREKEEQYRNVFEATEDGLSITDLDGFYIEANPAYCRMLGYTHEELIGMNYAQTIFPEYYPVLEESARAIEAGGQYQTQGLARRKDGSPLSVEAHATPFIYQGKPHVLGVMHDITERVEAEQKLREKEEQYRSVFEATSDGLIIRDMDGYVVEANPAAYIMHGYTYEEFIGLHRTDIIDPADHPMVAEYMRAIQAGRSFMGQAVDLRKDGTAFPVEVRGSTFTYLGKPHTLSVLRDITERVEAERQLREKEEQYRAVFEATTDGLVILDPDGFYVEANPAMCSLFGYTHEELIGLHTSVLTAPESLDVLTTSMEKIKGGEGFQAEGLALRKEGTTFYAEAHLTPFTYQGKPHLLAATHDITERVQAQQLLEQRVEERTRELASLLEISHTVASTLQLDPLLGLILDQLKTVVDYTGSAILAVDGEELIILDNRSPIQEVQLMQLRFPLKELGQIWETMISRETIIMPDVRDDTYLARAFRAALGELGETTFSYVRACMVVPLSLKDQVIGMLVLTSSKEDAFIAHHATLALAIANQAAVAIENARLYEQAQALAAVEERQRLARELPIRSHRRFTVFP
jgi:PAS domain S-box-containing protein